jgi:hypothetical protein
MTEAQRPMPDMATLIEEWTEAGVLAVDTQVYDLTMVAPFIDEMVEAAAEAHAPMMQGGLLPAKRTLLVVSANEEREASFGLYLEDIGGGVIRCAFAAHLMHNEVVRLLNASVAKLRRRMVEGNLTVVEQSCVRTLEESAWMDTALPQNQIIPLLQFTVGQTVDDAPENARAMARFASAACEFMAMPIAGKTPGALPRAARRRLERKGKAVAITNVTVSRSVTAGLNRPHQPGEHGKALHFVSGHWRISPTSLHGQMVNGQWKIWIEGHWRGDPEYGVVLHRYLARKRNKQQEGMAA